MGFYRTEFWRLGSRPPRMTVLPAVAALVLLPSFSAAKEPTARWFFVEQAWSRYEETYAEDSPAVIVESRVSAEVKGSYNLSIEQLKSRIIAVFDAEEAEDVFNYVERVPPGIGVKSVYAWSKELGNDTVHWAESSDIHKRKMFGGYTELRVAIPGFGGKGICGIEVKLEGEYLGDQDFMNTLPVVQGEFRLLVYRSRLGMNVLTHGNVEREDPQRVTEGMLYVWKVKDLPARSRSSILSARYRERAEIIFISPRMTWARWAEGFDRFLSDLDRLPKKFVGAAKDTLKDAPPDEIVRAVFRTLDDPNFMKAEGPMRAGLLGSLDWDEVFSSKSASSFTKAVVAHLLLKELGVTSRVVLGASRQMTLLDLRDANPFNMDADLLFVPDLGEEFLVDVGNRSVPLGYAGGDLYSEMFVVDKEGPATREFKTWKEDQCSLRYFDLQVDDDGLLTGSLRCVYEGLEFWDLDPWKVGEDRAGLLEETLGASSTVTLRDWALPGDEMRCYLGHPVEMTCDIELEAAPFGEEGWAVSLPNRPLPPALREFARAKEKFPVFLQSGMALEDSVCIGAGEAGGSLVVVQAPDPIRLTNVNGSVILSWEKSGNGIVIRRSLSLAQGEVHGRGIHNLDRLLSLWKEAGEQQFVVALD